MEQALLRFERYLKRRFGQSSTPKHYLSDLNIFIRTIGNKSPKAVTAEDVDAFVDHQISAGMSPTTINRRLSSMRAFFEYLASERPECPWPNPVVKRRHRLKTGSHLPRDAADRDVAALFATIRDQRDRAMFGLMVGAGLRVGEVATLRLESIVEPTEPGRLASLKVRGKGNKERTTWLPALLWETLRAWLQVRPSTETDYLFINHRGRPLSVGGIQYRLKGYCQTADVKISCHQLRHTYARRLAEHGLPVDSLARLLGHSQLHTTQHYIDGADPTLRADFASAMAALEASLNGETKRPLELSSPPRSTHGARTRTKAAPQAQLEKLRQKLTRAELPPWLHEATEAYLRWRWPTWRTQTAYSLGGNFIVTIRRIWAWMEANRQIEGWETFRRVDLEAWLQARYEDGVGDHTIRSNVGMMRMLLKFVDARGVPLDPGLFRVKQPRIRSDPLPRYLTEEEYRRLETTIVQATRDNTYDACFDRAWFLTLAHTGLRLSEMLGLHVEDIELAAGRAIVRGSKPGRDRVVYLSPPLVNALGRYLAHRPDLPYEQRLFVLHGRSASARTIQRRLAGYGQQAGVQVSPHKLRHTIATRLVNQGMPIHSLRKLLGHQHINMTQRYARIYDETLHKQFKETMSRLDAIAVEGWPGSEEALFKRRENLAHTNP